MILSKRSTFLLSCLGRDMGVSFKSPQREIPPALFRRPQFFAITHSQAEMSALCVEGLVWGLAVLKLKG